jgi:hypothetical protein
MPLVKVNILLVNVDTLIKLNLWKIMISCSASEQFHANNIFLYVQTFIPSYVSMIKFIVHLFNLHLFIHQLLGFQHHLSTYNNIYILCKESWKYLPKLFTLMGIFMLLLLIPFSLSYDFKQGKYTMYITEFNLMNHGTNFALYCSLGVKQCLVWYLNLDILVLFWNKHMVFT